ncbi:MAG: type IV pilus secretin PilQ, partial [Endozoicomonadaceae bacterium]|nr:type IV pilus secretin PilQ [Endozoicomonadaceae bacterium]
PDGRIIMDVDVKNNEVTSTDAKGNPISSLNEINTQLLVNNGQTVVLGGVFKKTIEKSRQRVPLLGNIPLIGALFSNKVDKDEKSELLIFITPKIITESMTAN